MTPALRLLQRRTILLSSSSSSSRSSVAVRRINNNLSFIPASSAYLAASSAHLNDTSRRPIVLIYGWLTAKPRHVHKYAKLYLGTYVRYLLEWFTCMFSFVTLLLPVLSVQCVSLADVELRVWSEDTWGESKAKLGRNIQRRISRLAYSSL